MAASKMRFSRSSHPGTNLRCPGHSGGAPRLAQGPRRAHRLIAAHEGLGRGWVDSSDRRAMEVGHCARRAAVQKAYLEIYHHHSSEGRELHSRRSNIMIAYC